MAENDPAFERLKSRFLENTYDDYNELLLDAIEIFCEKALQRTENPTAFDVAAQLIAKHLSFRETIEPGKQPYVRFPAQTELSRPLEKIEIRDMEVRRFLIGRISRGLRVGSALSAAEDRFAISYKTADGIWQKTDSDVRENAKRRGAAARESLKNGEKNSTKKRSTFRS
jgi:hypothetical protein